MIVIRNVSYKDSGKIDRLTLTGLAPHITGEGGAGGADYCLKDFAGMVGNPDPDLTPTYKVTKGDDRSE